MWPSVGHSVKMIRTDEVNGIPPSQFRYDGLLVTVFPLSITNRVVKRQQTSNRPKEEPVKFSASMFLPRRQSVNSCQRLHSTYVVNTIDRYHVKHYMTPLNEMPKLTATGLDAGRFRFSSIWCRVNMMQDCCRIVPRDKMTSDVEKITNQAKAM